MKQIPSSSINLISIGIVLLILLFCFPQSGFPFSKLADYLGAFKDESADIRRAALDQLLSCQEEDKECLEGGSPESFGQLVTAVIPLLDDPDPNVREASILYLKQSTLARMVTPIARRLRDANDDVRATAAEAFYLIKVDSATVRELERLLLDKNKRVRMGAASSLGLNGTKKSVGLLRKALAHEADQDARELYTETLKELEKRLVTSGTAQRNRGQRPISP